MQGAAVRRVLACLPGAVTPPPPPPIPSISSPPPIRPLLSPSPPQLTLCKALLLLNSLRP